MLLYFSAVVAGLVRVGRRGVVNGVRVVKSNDIVQVVDRRVIISARVGGKSVQVGKGESVFGISHYEVSGHWASGLVSAGAISIIIHGCREKGREKGCSILVCIKCEGAVKTKNIRYSFLRVR